MLEYILITTLLLWLAYIATMKMIGDIRDIKALPMYKRIGVYSFLVVDVLHNFLVAPFIFIESAEISRATLSERLRWILYRKSTGDLDKYWRKPIARFMCKYMVEPWDFGHCAYG